MRHNALNTDQAIKILGEEGSIYWTEEEYGNPKSTIDWDAVSKFFKTDQIHTYCNGYVTRVYDSYKSFTMGITIGK